MKQNKPLKGKKQCPYLVPEWMHYILTKRAGILRAVLIRVKTCQYRGAQVFIIQLHNI